MLRPKPAHDIPGTGWGPTHRDRPLSRKPLHFAMTRSNPIAFLSYSHDSDDHRDRVLELAQQLRMHGIDARVDRFVASPAEGWARWMQQQLEEAEFVLAICTSTYKRRFEGVDEASESGNGSMWEGFLSTQIIYDDRTLNTKCIPIVMPGSKRNDIPRALRSGTSYELPREWIALLRRLTKQPEVIAGVLGEIPKLAPLGAAPIVSDGINPTAGRTMIDENPRPADEPTAMGEEAQSGGTALAVETAEIELLIDRDFDSYDEADQRRLLSAIGILLGTADEVRVKHKRRGSVRLTISIPADAVERLRLAVEAGVLAEHGVTRVHVLPSGGESTRSYRPHGNPGSDLSSNPEIVSRIASSTGQTKVVVRDILQRFLDEIIDELTHGNSLEFREFGVFEVRERGPRRVRDPRTLERVEIPAKRIVKFKVGRLMRERVMDEPPESRETGTS